MGLVGGLEWVNSYSKKQCRSLFWRLRAAVKKAAKTGGGGGGKHQLKFQYDPWSYALNFDDGCCCNLGEEEEERNAFHRAEIENFHESITWVYVIWLEDSH